MDHKEFKEGSMKPKVEACVEFVKNTKKVAIITSLEKALPALNLSLIHIYKKKIIGQVSCFYHQMYHILEKNWQRYLHLHMII